MRRAGREFDTGAAGAVAQAALSRPYPSRTAGDQAVIANSRGRNNIEADAARAGCARLA